jgi:IclR family mhp operon transcriptional activator
MPVKRRETALKALRVLEGFGVDGDATSAQVAARTGLTRVTAYGILETLVEAGYLYRDGPRDQYRLTNRPMLLARGLNTITHTASVAVPVLARFTAETHWPVEFTVRSGLQMLILETSDRLSSNSIARLKRRDAVPIHRCAAGFAYLAFCCEREQRAIRDEMVAQRLTSLSMEIDQNFFDTYLPLVRDNGYSRIDLPEYGERSLAAPICVDGVTIGALQLRYIKSAVIDWRHVGERLICESKAIGRSVERIRLEVARHLAVGAE